MKLNEYQLKSWDGMSIVKYVNFGRLKILLLKVDLTKMPPKEGEKNLLAIDADDDIIWIASLPDKVPYASFEEITLNNNILTAWSGSNLLEINPVNGMTMTNRFIW